MGFGLTLKVWSLSNFRTLLTFTGPLFLLQRQEKNIVCKNFNCLATSITVHEIQLGDRRTDRWIRNPEKATQRIDHTNEIEIRPSNDHTLKGLWNLKVNK